MTIASDLSTLGALFAALAFVIIVARESVTDWLQSVETRRDPRA